MSRKLTYENLHAMLNKMASNEENWLARIPADDAQRRAYREGIIKGIEMVQNELCRAQDGYSSMLTYRQEVAALSDEA